MNYILEAKSYTYGGKCLWKMSSIDEMGIEKFNEFRVFIEIYELNILL